MHSPLIYLHIPKTAGTSFRVSAEKYYGDANVLRDYGADSGNTSSDIIDSFYNCEDKSSLRTAGLKKKFLCGHFSLPRYREVFPDSRVMTFFREPVKRVISEFVHFTNHHDYTGTLEQFYRDPKFQNRQHHSLCGARPADLDFYGITEHYKASIDKFNKRYGTQLEVNTLNIGSYNAGSPIKPNESQLEEIAHLNQADIALYASALESFEKQPAHTRLARTMATRYLGNLGGIADSKLYGWVTDSKNDTPVTLRIAVNGVYLTRVKADKKRPDLVRNGIHNDGHCGFELPLAELGTISPQDSISVSTEDGAFELPSSPLVLAA